MVADSKIYRIFPKLEPALKGELGDGILDISASCQLQGFSGVRYKLGLPIKTEKNTFDSVLVAYPTYKYMGDIMLPKEEAEREPLKILEYLIKNPKCRFYNGDRDFPIIDVVLGDMVSTDVSAVCQILGGFF